MAALFEEPCPAGNAARTALLTAHRVALWDVIQSCEIAGSADSTIRQVLPNDIAALLRQAPIRRIFTNGATADRLYRRYCRAATGIPAVPLPSTSPANARCGFEDLLRQWRVITE